MRGNVALLCTVAALVAFPRGLRAISNPDPPHLLLLLDSSFSMASQNRLEKMNVAVRGWIENFVPDGIQLSLWKFTNDATKIKTAVIDSTPDSRQEIIKSIPEAQTGSSCISCAIETVLQHESNKFTVILITDGSDKYLAQDLNDLTRKIELSQCNIIAALMGNSPANIHLLEELTEGAVSHVADTNTILGLLHVLQTALESVKNVSAPINILEEEFASSETNFETSFNVDRSIAPYVCINLYYWPYTMPLSVNLTTPTGENQRITDSTHGFMKYCHLPEIVGSWKMYVFSSIFNKFIALQVTANKNVTDTASDITSNCWIEMGNNDLSICGSIHPGKYLINNTKISVDITTQHGEVIKQELLQIYSGNNKNMYVRKHLNIGESGYYTARCWATGQLLEVSSKITEPQQFTRVSWAGTFWVEKTYRRLTIPTEIKDLQVLVDSHAEKCSITMEFTVPTNAVKYKLKLSSSLYNVVSSEGLILATVPGIAGRKEKITFRIPPHYLSSPVPLYIIVSTIGKQAIESEASNIAVVVCQENHTNKFSPSIEATTVSTSFENKDNSSTATTEQGYERSISLVSDVNSLFTSYDHISTTSGISDSSISVIGVSTNKERSWLGVAELLGLLVVVLVIVVAVVGLLYLKFCNRRKCRSYRVASRQSNPLELNDQEDL